MGFRNFGKVQLGKYSANFNWEGAISKGLVNAMVVPTLFSHSKVKLRKNCLQNALKLLMILGFTFKSL